VATPLLVVFCGGRSGAWAVQTMETIIGAPLEHVPFVDVTEGPAAMRRQGEGTWVLRGVTSNERYVTRAEHESLHAAQEPLGRHSATRAALLPVTKSAEWWELAQDERRRIFEETSRHVATGLEYLPAIARRLHHGRDLGEPFDFLTWFEFAPEDEARFDELVTRLRSSEEWRYVERELDIRLARASE